MTILQAQARLDAARRRYPAALAGYTRVIEFFDGRDMTVAPLARALIARGEAHLEAGAFDPAMADARRALEVARSLQGDKPHSSYTGLALLLIARVQERLGERAAVRETTQEAMPNLAKTLGEQHPAFRIARELNR